MASSTCRPPRRSGWSSSARISGGWQRRAGAFGPFWADDEAKRATQTWINARAETAWDSPAFGRSLRKRRCVIPADAFYEWDRTASPRQPYAIGPAAEGEMLALAGIWSPIHGEAPTAAIMTTAPNELLASVHNRMPVILDRGLARRLAGSGRRPRATSSRCCARRPLSHCACGPWALPSTRWPPTGRSCCVRSSWLPRWGSPEPMPSPEAVLVTGTFGSGKTTVVAEMAELIERRDFRYAALDLDWLAWGWPGDDESEMSEFRADAGEPGARRRKLPATRQRSVPARARHPDRRADGGAASGAAHAAARGASHGADRGDSPTCRARHDHRSGRRSRARGGVAGGR